MKHMQHWFYLQIRRETFPQKCQSLKSGYCKALTTRSVLNGQIVEFRDLCCRLVMLNENVHFVGHAASKDISQACCLLFSRNPRALSVQNVAEREDTGGMVH